MGHADRISQAMTSTGPRLIWLVLLIVGWALPAQPILGDVLVTKNGIRHEGQVRDLGDSYQLILPSGGKTVFPKHMVERVEKGASATPGTTPAQPPNPSPASQPQPPRAPRASVPVDIGSVTGSQKEPAGDEKLMQVVATGIALDADAAIQTAFSQAIGQAVGVLVDAETLVKNDQIVSDNVLTFSRGFIRSFKVIRQWQQGSLHYARIAAMVETGKLTERLQANKIATREIPGELLARQFRFDVKNEAEAAEMLTKILAGFDMMKLTKVEIVGKPEVSRDGANAQMQIKARVAPDLARWREFARELRPLLDKTATKRAGITVRGSLGIAWVGNDALEKQLRGDGVLVGLFTGTNISGDKTQWELFRVPEPMEGAVKDAARRMQYRAAFVLLTQDGSEILQTSQTVSCDSIAQRPSKPIHRGHAVPLGYVWWIGPVFWSEDYMPAPLYDLKATVVLSQEDLQKVARVAVSLEKDAEE